MIVKGTVIETAKGLRKVETLRIGDVIPTLTNGDQQIIWIGSRTVPASGAMVPVVCKAGSIGNTSDLVVSPEHLLMPLKLPPKSKPNLGALIRAAALLNDEDVLLMTSASITYFHFMFAENELVNTNGVPSCFVNPHAEPVCHGVWLPALDQPDAVGNPIDKMN
jgi:Hint domain